MLSERGMQIIEKLIESNRTPITSKILSMYLGVSERSVKTYIKEVSDFCEEHNMKLERKPGIGFLADFSQEQIDEINRLKKDKKIVMSKKQRMSYIMYILLSGWDTYTLSLFSEELNVSKKVISDDIDTIYKEFGKYNIKINRVAGHGVFITGDEFSIRRAMRSYCGYEIGNKKIEKSHDYRMSIEEEELWINNFGQDNVEKAIEIIHFIEKKYDISYTDYSFKMLIEYMSIGLFRIRMGNLIEADIKENAEIISNENMLNDVVHKLCELGKVHINEYEKQYVDVLLGSAAVQEQENMENIVLQDGKKINSMVCNDILEYLSEILNVELMSNKLLQTSLEAFIPASFVRTKFGIEVKNPFLGDIREMYSGIFATCFTVGKFYEQYVGTIPTDHEISFLALFVGGALHRNIKIIKAVLIGTLGVAAANITARKIENKIENIKVVAILPSEKMNNLEEYEFDIVLSLISGFEYGDVTVHISPVINVNDEKKIKDKCFEILSHPELQKGFSSLIDEKHILFIQEKTDKESVLKVGCTQLCEDGYVTKDFLDDVLRREKIEPTAIGSGVAIPHGMPENVIVPKVMVVRLLTPINWGEKLVDTVFILALNFNNIATTKAFFHDFARILGTEEKIGKIREATNIEEIEKTIKTELHW